MNDLIPSKMDKPEILAAIFHPRREIRNDTPPSCEEFEVTVSGDTILGCRFFNPHTNGPVIIYFHGNGETVSDYDQIAPYYPVPRKPNVDFLLLETQKEWSFADLEFQVIETPGHTPGGCCLLFAASNIMITGDTLFKGSCGRTDLPGGDPRVLKDSLNRLKQLPDEIKIYPGHGLDSTIGIERASNFFMQ